MGLIRHLLFGKRGSGNQRLLIDVRQILGDRASIPADQLLQRLVGRRLIYETWSPDDLVEELAKLDIPLAGKGRSRTVRRAAVVKACEK